MSRIPTLSAASEGAARNPARRRFHRLSGWGQLVLVLLVALLFGFPFYWVIVTAFSKPSEVLKFPPDFFPGTYLRNFVVAWDRAPWTRYFLNTILIAGCTVLLALITSILAGFALGVTRFRSRNTWFVIILSLLMIPPVAILIPDYVILNDLHWLNTYQAQIIPWGASVFGIFLLRQAFLALPDEVIEAAELDGAGQLRFLWSVGLPLVTPSLIVISLYIFIGSWDSFLWPFIMTSSPSVQPVEVGLASFFGAIGTQWTELSAAVVFTTLPIVLVFIVAQRRLIEGAYAASSGSKG
jgi:multiple sugar transport system permease protein